MSQGGNSETSQERNEVEETATFEDLDQGITFEIDLTKEENRLIIRVRDDYQFST